MCSLVFLVVIRDSLLGSLPNERLVSEGLAMCVHWVSNSENIGADKGVDDKSN